METPIRYKDNLTLGSYVYNLKSIVTHIGNSSSGHFFTVQKNWCPVVDFYNINQCVPNGELYQELNWAFSSDSSFFIRNSVSK